MMRSEEFEDGAERVRSPQFSSIQQQGIRNYQQTSVLDNLRPNNNGLGENDLQRKLLGVDRSASGSAQSTFDQRLWLRNREPTVRNSTLNREG